jgi:hypothetical protein
VTAEVGKANEEDPVLSSIICLQTCNAAGTYSTVGFVVDDAYRQTRAGCRGYW